MAYNRSTFPETLDTWLEHRNIQASDIPNVQRFQELTLKSSRTPTEDDELASLTITLREKIFSPEDFNKLQDAMAGMQRYLRDEIDGDIATKQAQFQAEIDKFVFLEEYNPSTTYQKKNIVSYQGQSYICKVNGTVGTLPTDTSKWSLIAKQGSQGIQGQPGTGLRFKGAYNATTNYTVDDAVSYGGQVYACLFNNIGQEPNPNQDTVYWGLAVSKGESTKVALLKKVVNISDSRTNVSLGIVEFNKTTDGLMVIQNSVVLTEGVDYQINANGSSIDKTNGTWDGTVNPVEFQFIVFKNFVVDLTFSDGNMIQDETVSKAKLSLALQSELDGKATIADVNAADRIKLVGSSTFNSTTGTVISHSIGHTNYYPTIIPTTNPNGYLGEIWVEKAANSFKVLCSGSATVSFDYMVVV